MALFQLGDVNSGNEKLREAVRRSEDGQTDLQFSAVMALFSRESQFQAPDESLPALSRLRQFATSLGDAVSIGVSIWKWRGSRG